MTTAAMLPLARHIPKRHKKFPSNQPHAFSGGNVSCPDASLGIIFYSQVPDARRGRFHSSVVASARPFSAISASNMPSTEFITVRLVSINDVYDLKKLPRLATLVRSLGRKEKNQAHNNNTMFPINGYGSNNFNGACNLPSVPPSAVTLNGDFLSPSALSSIDNGRGHVAAIRSAGITHVSLGNHEADLPLEVVKERLGELGQRGSVKVLNSNVSGLGRHSCQVDIVSSECGKIKVGLMGLLSDENGMFRDGTFRGLEIFSVKEKYETLFKKMKLMESVNCLVPLTHQTLDADIKLARRMLEIHIGEEGSPSASVILGGHEHVKIQKIVTHEEDSNQHVHIVKTGQDAERAAIIDLQFDPSSCKLRNVNVHFEELDERYSPCPIVKSVVDKHLSALDNMDKFKVLDTKNMLSDYFVDPVTHRILPLSSEFTRYEQTTVGAFFCTAIRSELNTDVCIINGAPIKGSTMYTDGTMSYDQLKSELPFPLKMIVVEMTRKQLRDAIQYSRMHVEEGKPAMVMNDGRIERRGYLQTDFDYWRHSARNHDINHNDDILSVAMPRNLLKGFCKIQPLMALNDELEAKNALPSDDDYIKAVDLIVRYCCKDRWVTIAKQFSFSELDLRRDGTLCRDDIRSAMRIVLKEEPSDGLVDEMVNAIDLDANGYIDEEEFNQILARVSRQS